MRTLFAIICVLLSACAHAELKSACSSDEQTLRSNAKAGGFSAPIESGERWTSLGTLNTKSGFLCPFEYVRVWGQSGRATARLVIFSSNMEYLGSYGLTSPNNIAVKGSQILITSMSGAIDVVEFDGDQLPEKIYVDGEVVAKFL